MNENGSYGNPYSYSTYLTMFQGQTWSGGWVIHNEDLVYFTSSGVEEKDNPDGLLGSENNPFSSTAYDEMIAYSTWVGGWVMVENTTLYYPASGEGGEGCGCGSGEGCGCGCGEGCGCGGLGTGLLVAGEVIYRPDVFYVNTYLELSWEDGSFLHGGQPGLYVELTNGDNMDITNLHFSWENPYRIKITFDIILPGHLTRDFCYYSYNIPSQYRR